MHILKKYRSGWTVSIPSSWFTFGEDGKLKGILEKKSGNGWQAGINGSSEVRCHQNVPQIAIYNVPGCSCLFPHKHLANVSIYMYVCCMNISLVSHVYS